MPPFWVSGNMCSGSGSFFRPPVATIVTIYYLLLENGTDRFLLEDSSGLLLME